MRSARIPPGPSTSAALTSRSLTLRSTMFGSVARQDACRRDCWPDDPDDWATASIAIPRDISSRNFRRATSCSHPSVPPSRDRHLPAPAGMTTSRNASTCFLEHPLRDMRCRHTSSRVRFLPMRAPSCAPSCAPTCSPVTGPGLLPASGITGSDTRHRRRRGRHRRRYRPARPHHSRRRTWQSRRRHPGASPRRPPRFRPG